MDDMNMLLFDAQVDTDKSKIKKIYIVGGVIFLLAAGAATWGHLYWDEYTHQVQNVLTGEVSTVGPASIAWSWGLIIGIAIPVIYGLMWLSIDFKNPAIGVNKGGVFINQEGFKKAYLRWDEFDRIEKKGDELRLYMKNPEEVVKRQPAAMRPFLTQTFVKDRSPYTIKSSASTSGNVEKVIELVGKYSGMVN